ncbi:MULTISPECIES: LarC family nickel insertion protein [unclassified Pseudodesulfovibrio]|uniref:LarC family nickel insertion protein n=1 Tax=unclassified Pseudodesulfovibrio TaxID=2661612 RepID=UPI000FEB6B82|nr:MULTISPECIES: LarC family nickel insertion protein [unclassified Pseudodesulfovibrio]MCJ2165177.1 LarC family nickel insertion protein [Pseudodesulfovibrio sp. S3-i]RWU03373.1 LarC family nickel insertion protein [Pseudodesulfovibrio sp. S3]
MKTLYLDCSTGVSGDMLLASLAHALEEWKGVGKGFAFLEQELDRLGLIGFELHWSEKQVAGIRTNHVDVVQTQDQPLRHYSDIRKIIEESGIDGHAAQRSMQALRLLGEAEAKVHGVDLEQVHFHEIGAVDTIVDICGTMVLLEALGIGKVIVSPVDLGSGFVDCAHGRMPVPAPACAELAQGLITFGSDCAMERATPTGLTILRTIADGFGSMPLGSILSVGYGSGGRSSDAQPTSVRAFVLESVEVDKPVRNHKHA